MNLSTSELTGHFFDKFILLCFLTIADG